MSDPKDSAIKLFGKTIPVAEIGGDDASQDQDRPSASCDLQSDAKVDGDDKGIDEDIVGEKPAEEGKPENNTPTLISEDSSNPDTASVDKDDEPKPSKTEEEHSDSSNSQDKILKKPDKILPCPRCNSMDTKFCYYNNYNVNQPRHFCKNCQRYWTAGGTMRNVPVGAGRRKNKTSGSHYRHLTIPEALQNNGFHHPLLKTNGSVLTFGSDPPLHESMASVLNLADKTMQGSTRNGFHKPEPLKIPNGSSAMALDSKEETSKNGSEETAMQNFPSFPPQIPYFPGALWPYGWSTPVPPPPFCPPGYPMPFYPAPPYWGCAVPGAWNMPWVPHPNSNQGAPSSGPNSPTLGKHSREETMAKQDNAGEEQVKERNAERCLWIPKTLRIEDPGEAAKSSIWTTLGIKQDKTNLISGRGLFKAFDPKNDEQNLTVEAATVLQANPAALSRSVKFHERS